jgi:hypothetical protein
VSRKLTGLLVAGFLFSMSGSALAAGPANVTVRAEGTSGPVIPVSQLTTTSTPVAKDGSHSCTGTSAAGALEQATGGDWGGPYYSSFNDYGVERVKAENYPFSQQEYYWAVYVNDVAAAGICSAELSTGDELLLAKTCGSATTGCYSGDVLSARAATTTVTPGAPVGFYVEQVSNGYAATPPYDQFSSRAPSAGAVLRAGAMTATTDAGGHATLALTDRGPQTVRVTKGTNNVPDEIPVCVTDGADGFCGNAKPTEAGAPCVTTGDDGRCGSPDKRAAYGFVTGVKEGQKFGAGKGPRELTGRVDQDPAGVADVQVRLTSKSGKSCLTFDGKREAFKPMNKCGAVHGTWFSVGSSGDWRYLLPKRLGAGRYVLDVRVIDKAGNRDDKLARGRNRVVFQVG